VSWVRVLGRVVPLAWKLSNRKQQKNGAKIKIVCFDEEIIGTRVATLKTVLGSSPSEDCFCSLEIKHGRRMVPRPKLFLSKSRLQE
jgi:hypothetical protein